MHNVYTVYNVHTVHNVHNVHTVHNVHNVRTLNSEQFTKKQRSAQSRKIQPKVQRLKKSGHQIFYEENSL